MSNAEKFARMIHKAVQSADAAASVREILNTAIAETAKEGDTSEPKEVLLDLIRFLAKAWADTDDFVHQYCGPDALVHYPVVQGTANQMALRKIAGQPYDPTNVARAIKWLEPKNLARADDD